MYAIRSYYATAVVWIVYDYVHQYLSLNAVIVGVLMLVGMIGVIIVVLVEAHEWAEALWFKERLRRFTAMPVADSDLPMVSIHVPAYNEPPAMLIDTLDALARRITSYNVCYTKLLRLDGSGS